MKEPDIQLDLLAAIEPRAAESSAPDRLIADVIAALRTVHDPEIPVNIYDLGLIYRIEPKAKGMLMTTLRNHNEVVAASSAFEGLKKRKVDKDMAEIASMIIDKKKTSFDPGKFEDTYEEALIAMIDAKRKGRKLPKAAPRPKENVVDLMDVLKKSLASESGGAKRPAKKKSAA